MLAKKNKINTAKRIGGNIEKKEKMRKKWIK
jgi:hypothetical protein